MKKKILKVKTVLCNRGEADMTAKPGTTARALIGEGGEMLDRAYLHNVLVIQGTDGKYYIGEFQFRLDRVSKKEALRIAFPFSDENEYPDSAK